mmetsp:Transcript_28171/g.40343  ORF Transcript_28171/g.40343 Transcript_28171/m.40343 type:complete len:86 (-) Transcript_28171:507-764(-)
MTSKCRAITGEYDRYYHSPKTGKIFPSAKKAMIFNQIVEEFHGSEDDAFVYFKKHESSLRNRDWRVKWADWKVSSDSRLSSKKVT